MSRPIVAPPSDHSAEISGQPVFWRSGATAPGRAPVLYVHGVPTSSDDWLEFLQLTGGIAPDLPGFGRSGKRGDLDYSVPGYTRFFVSLLDHLKIDRVRLVMHDWGTAALGFAQQHPDRVERVVIMNAVPLLPGYRWHRVARLWRTRGVGELLQGSGSRWSFRQLSREANATRGPMPDQFVDDVWRHWDQGTQRAILRLYRWADPDVLAAAGARLGEVKAPALVLWGDADPYIPARFADAYGEALGGKTVVEHIAGAGHWPWLDRPEIVERVAGFLDA